MLGAHGTDAEAESSRQQRRGHVSQTIKRATEIIEHLADRPSTLAELADQFGQHRSTVFRQLQSLEEAGFVLHRADGTYSIGPRLIAIGQEALNDFNLRNVAHDELRELQQRVGCTVHLAQLIENSVVYVDKIEDSSGIRMYSRIGKTVLPQCTGVGKVILAQITSSRRDDVLAGVEWKPYTANTLLTREALDAEIEQIREDGWGVDDSEFEEITNCIAAPVRDSTGAIVGAISVTALRVLQDLDALQLHLPDLLETAGRISARLD